LDRTQALYWLKQTNPSQLSVLWGTANDVRRDYVGNAVHLRGLVEISNHCRRSCGYCGIRADNRLVDRYRMTYDEILSCAQQACEFDYGTVVLQAGEDPGLRAEWVRDVVVAIKRLGLAVTLSLGERSLAELAMWKEAGADRYLLRFETSNNDLYEKIHPSLPHERSDRLALLRAMRAMGYEIGSGIMVGIPGQDWDTLADDILTFGSLDLDMIGVGPFLPHPQTPLGMATPSTSNDQVPATEDVVYRVLALTRIHCPEANIPSTTALATINKTDGRELGLMRGANIVMPNLTPVQYRLKYEIYPDKACVNETAEACCEGLEDRIYALGRTIGRGPGGRNREIA
jgi:biotin synthase